MRLSLLRLLRLLWLLLLLRLRRVDDLRFPHALTRVQAHLIAQRGVSNATIRIYANAARIDRLLLLPRRIRSYRCVFKKERMSVKQDKCHIVLKIDERIAALYPVMYEHPPLEKEDRLRFNERLREVPARVGEIKRLADITQICIDQSVSDPMFDDESNVYVPKLRCLLRELNS